MELPGSYLWRNRIRHNLVYLRLRIFLNRHESTRLVKPGKTQLCVECYPRSGNTYAVEFMRCLNSDLVMAHHTHSPQNLIRAVNCSVPALSILRCPLDAVTSYLCFYPKRQPEEALDLYVRFYSAVGESLAEVVLVRFEQAIDDFNQVIELLNQRFSKSFRSSPDPAATDRQARQQILNEYRGLSGTDRLRKLPIPREQPPGFREPIRDQVRSAASFPVAVRLYEELQAAVEPSWVPDA